MASHLVVTSIGKCIKVDFGIYAALPAVTSPQLFNARTILNVRPDEHNPNELIIVELITPYDHGNKFWPITYNQLYAGEKGMIVDFINGVAPTSQAHLFDLLATLFA